MSDWDGEERRNPTGWHLKREISLGHLITTVTIAMSGIGYVVANEKNHSTHAARLDSLQAIVVELKASDLRQDARLDSAISRIETKIDRVDDKLERMTRR